MKLISNPKRLKSIIKSYKLTLISLITVNLFRYFVGILFIFSGLIKLNDPIGFSFKLEEYFGPTVFNLEFLIPLALPMAVFIVVFEVILGIFLILGFRKRLTLWSLLLMIIFFTFLTWYSAYFNKVTDCGCFGDAIKLTPWESFTKDVVLLIMIIYLFLFQELIKPIFKLKIQKYIIGLSLIICFYLTYHVLNHLPILDFRAYKIGDNIMANMSIPDNAPKDIYDYSWEFLVDGEKKIITTNGEYPKVSGEFVDVKTKLIKKGYEPKIYDFSIEINGKNLTDEILSEQKLVIYVSYNLDEFSLSSVDDMLNSAKKARNNGYKVIGLTSSPIERSNAFAKTNDIFFEFYTCDETALKTVIRSNPGVIVLHEGTVKQKKHFNDFSNLNFN
tara:strand:+ start:1504 stop:2667 length:1164 start_codon:yes stop_codon:yes gene_type:complete